MSDRSLCLFVSMLVCFIKMPYNSLIRVVCTSKYNEKRMYLGRFMRGNIWGKGGGVNAIAPLTNRQRGSLFAAIDDC